MAVKYPITLSVSEPNNNIGLLKVRQADEESQTLVIQILEDAVPKNYEGLQAFFCARIGQTAGLGIIEQKLNSEEMKNPRTGQLEYTFRPEDWQVLGRQTGYFSFRKMIDDHTFIQQFSTRDFTYEVTKSVYSDGIKEITKDGSTYVWTIEDLKRLYEEYIASGKTDWEFFVNQNKEIIESIDPGGELLSKLGVFDSFREFDSQVMDKMKNEFTERGVNPKWFGAVGDGITDDGAAIKRAHQYANENNYPVVYPSNHNFYISEVDEIPIKTPVDFNYSTITVNENPANGLYSNPLFVISDDDTKSFINDSITSELGSVLKKGYTGPFPQLAEGASRFVEVYDDNDKILARKGSSSYPAQPKRDIFKIDSKGKILSEIIYDFKNITRIVSHDIPNRIYVQNLKLVSVNNAETLNSGDYVLRNFKITRSSVTLSNISHYVVEDTNKKRPSRGAITAYSCTDLIIRDCKLMPRLSSGSYAITHSQCLDFLVDNCEWDTEDSSYWGGHAGNYMKNAVFNYCNVNRIDSHYPVHNLTITNSKIGDKGVLITGSGRLIIKDSTFKSEYLVGLRPDFGATWIGSMDIDNIDFYPKTEYPKIITSTYSLDFDFGVELRLGNDLVSVKNVRIHDSEFKDYLSQPSMIRLVDTETVESVVSYYTIGPKFYFKNITTDSGKGISIFHIDKYQNLRGHSESYYSATSDDNMFIRENCLITITSTDIGSFDIHPSNPTGEFGSSLIRPMFNSYYTLSAISKFTNFHLLPKFVIKDCERVRANILSLKSIIEIDNSSVRSALTDTSEGAQSIVKITNSRLKPYYHSSATSRAAFSNRGTYSNCVFELPSTEIGTVNEAFYITSCYQFLKIYESSSSIISPSAKIWACVLGKDFSLTILNSSIKDYGDVVDSLNLGGSVLVRQIGTTAQLPDAASKLINKGAYYFNTSTNKINVYTGSSWVSL